MKTVSLHDLVEVNINISIKDSFNVDRTASLFDFIYHSAVNLKSYQYFDHNVQTRFYVANLIPGSHGTCGTDI